MEQFHAEMLAVSLAGHDKGNCYVVLGQEEGFFLLANGESRPLERPKKKNQKHVQLIRHLPEEIAGDMDRISQNADVRRVLKLYGQRSGAFRENREE
mgnify:CR=1 FL=1